MRLASAAFVGLALASCATPKQPLDHSLEIALTFDDLPVHGPFPPGQNPQSVGDSIIAALSSARVPATGFVNAHWTVDQPGTISVLKAWRAAGLKLGNHGWAHKHLNEMTVAEFEQEVARDEPVLEQLAGGTDWRWFRYPFLDEGKDAAQRAAARQVLARRGYKVADVTMDFGDWQWTAPYARCSAPSDQAAIRHLETMYMAAAREAIGYYRGLSHQLYGRDIPYVILLHEVVRGADGAASDRALSVGGVPVRGFGRRRARSLLCRPCAPELAGAAERAGRPSTRARREASLADQLCGGARRHLSRRRSGDSDALSFIRRWTAAPCSRAGKAHR